MKVFTQKLKIICHLINNLKDWSLEGAKANVQVGLKRIYPGNFIENNNLEQILAIIYSDPGRKAKTAENFLLGE